MKAEKIPMGFDSLEYAHQLEKAGFTKDQAEGQTRAQQVMIAGLTDSYLATKSDIGGVKEEIQELREEIKDVRSEIKDVRSEIKDVRGEIKDVRGEIKDVRGEMKTEFKAVRGEMKEQEARLLLRISQSTVTSLLGTAALLTVALTIVGLFFR